MNCAKTRKGRSLHNGGCDQSLIRKYILMNGSPFSLELVFMKLLAELAYDGFCVGRYHKLFVCRKNVYLYL